MEEGESVVMEPLTAGGIGFLGGVVSGFMVGRLTAPQASSRIRRQFRQPAQNPYEVDDWADDMKETVDYWVEKDKKVVGLGWGIVMSLSTNTVSPK